MDSSRAAEGRKRSFGPVMANGADPALRDVMNRTPTMLAGVSNCVESDKLREVIDYLGGGGFH